MPKVTDLVISIIVLIVLGYLTWIGGPDPGAAFWALLIFFFIVEGFRIKSVSVAVCQAIVLFMVVATLQAARGVHMGDAYILGLLGTIAFLATFFSWVFVTIAERRSRKHQEKRTKGHRTPLLRAPVVLTFLVVAVVGLGRLPQPRPVTNEELLQTHLMAEAQTTIEVILVIAAAALWLRALVGFILALRAKARGKHETQGNES